MALIACMDHTEIFEMEYVSSTFTGNPSLNSKKKITANFNFLKKYLPVPEGGTKSITVSKSDPRNVTNCGIFQISSCLETLEVFEQVLCRSEAPVPVQKRLFRKRR